MFVNLLPCPSWSNNFNMSLRFSFLVGYYAFSSFQTYHIFLSPFLLPPSHPNYPFLCLTCPLSLFCVGCNAPTTKLVIHWQSTSSIIDHSMINLLLKRKCSVPYLCGVNPWDESITKIKGLLKVVATGVSHISMMFKRFTLNFQAQVQWIGH